MHRHKTNKQNNGGFGWIACLHWEFDGSELDVQPKQTVLKDYRTRRASTFVILGDSSFKAQAV